MDNSKLTLTYMEENTKDEILQEIKYICFSYLDDETSIDDLTDEELYFSYDFITTEFDKMVDLKEAMEIQNYSWNFTDIAQSLDEITLEQEFIATKNYNPKVKLTRDVNNILDGLTFCFGIINKILENRNLINE